MKSIAKFFFTSGLSLFDIVWLTVLGVMASQFTPWLWLLMIPLVVLSAAVQHTLEKY